MLFKIKIITNYKFKVFYNIKFINISINYLINLVSFIYIINDTNFHTLLYKKINLFLKF